MQAIRRGDCLIAWSASIYNVGSGSQVYSSLLEKFSMIHGDTVDDEHNFSSPNGRSVKKDHPDFRGHVMSMRL